MGPVKNKVEFEKALLERLVKSLRPDFAAVVCGPDDALIYSLESEQTTRKPDPGIVERVLETKEPAAESTERHGRLAVPYLDESDNVKGVMYIEVDSPRRLKKIDLAILERLREQIEARLKNSQRRGSSRESEAGAQKVTEATLDITFKVLKPPRAVVVAMVEGKLKALDARVRGGEKFSAKRSLDFRLLKSLMERGEPTHLTDALAPETLELLNLSEVRGESRSVVCSPLRNSENEVRGLVFLDSISEVGLFDGSELTILERLAHSLESELAWVLNEDGEFLHEPAEDPAGEYRSKFGGDTIDAAELYPISQLLALSEEYGEPTTESEAVEEPESISIELEREEPTEWSGFESDWPEFEAVNSWQDEPAAEHESDSMEVVTLERELETTEDVMSAVPAEVSSEEDEPPGDPSEDSSEKRVEPDVPPEELDAPGVLFEDVSFVEDEQPIPSEDELSEEDEEPVVLLEDESSQEGEEPSLLLEDESSQEDEEPSVLLEDESSEDGEEPGVILEEQSVDEDEEPGVVLEKESSDEDEEPGVLVEEEFSTEEVAFEELSEDQDGDEDEAASEDEPLEEEEASEGRHEEEPTDLPEEDGYHVPALEDVFALSDEPSFSLEPPETHPDFGAEEPRPLPTDPPDVLFQSRKISADAAEMSSKLEEAKASLTSEPEVLSDLMSSAKPLAPKKALPDDDILRSLLKEEPPENEESEEKVQEPLPEEEQNPEQETFSEPARPRKKRGGSEKKKPSFIKRAWKFFWPFGGKGGTFLTPVTISGEIFLDGKVENDSPVEVILFFPDQDMRVTLQLTDEESEYFFSGNFSGDEPPRVSLRVQKKGYFPTKIPRIKLHSSEEGFHAEINPIELLSRDF